MKRFLSLLVTLVLVLGMMPMAFAESASELPFVELEWYCRMDPVKPGVDAVMAKLNEYLKEKLNCQVNAHFFTGADYPVKMNTMVSSGQDMDILLLANVFPLVDNVMNGALMPIEDLLEEYAPETMELVPQALWNAATIDGHVYGIPAYKDSGRIYNLVYNKSMADELGVNADITWGSYYDLLPLFYEVKEKRDALHPEDADIPICWTSVYFEAFNPHETLISGNSAVAANIPGINAFANQGEGEIAFNLYATPEYRAYVNQVRKLVDDGIFPEDSQNFDPDSYLRNTGKIFAMFNSGLVSVDQHMYGDAFEVGLNSSTNACMYNDTIRGSVMGVSINSKHPERAVQVMNLINTDPYVATLLRFGIEGEHFLRTEDGRVTFEGAPKSKDDYYNWYGWQFGSIFNVEVPVGQPENLWDLIKGANEKMYKDTNLGFVFNNERVVNELAMCNSVIAEYTKALQEGLVDDPDAYLDEFLAKLDASGVDRIVEEVQNQLTAWRASVGRTVAQ